MCGLATGEVEAALAEVTRAGDRVRFRRGGRRGLMDRHDGGSENLNDDPAVTSATGP
jgi:hypothetical protein